MPKIHGNLTRRKDSAGLNQAGDFHAKHGLELNSITNQIRERMDTAELMRAPEGLERAKEHHRSMIAKAAMSGKEVPAHVLADYPDLAAKYGKQQPAPASAKFESLEFPRDDERPTIQEQRETKRVLMTYLEHAKVTGNDDAYRAIYGYVEKAMGGAGRAAGLGSGSRRMMHGYVEGAQKRLGVGGPVAPETRAQDMAEATKIARAEGVMDRATTDSSGTGPDPVPRTYIVNAKNKIELAFDDKAEFQQLDPSLQADIKRYFNWSPSANAWASKGYADSYQAREIAKRAGFGQPGEGFKPATPTAPASAPEVSGIPAGKLHKATHDDIPYDLAHAAHRGTSWTPEKRAEQVRQEYVDHIERTGQSLSKLADTPEKQAMLKHELEQYRQGYVSRLSDLLHAKSRIVSSAVAGPSNFPVRQMEKRSNAEDKRREELLDWSQRARTTIGRKIEGSTAIMAHMPDAVTKLQASIAEKQKLQETMKAVNQIVQHKKLSDDEKVARLGAEHAVSEGTARKFLQPDFAGRIGFPGYALTNNSAEIRRLKGRLQDVAKLHGVTLPDDEEQPLRKGPTTPAFIFTTYDPRTR